MKKIIFLLSVFMVIIGTNPAFATTITGKNITIADEVYGFANNTSWYGMQEDNEVEPGCTTGQNWDLEAFYLDNTKLSIVAGYNFLTGQDSIFTGGLFISYGMPVYGPNADNTGVGINIPNTFGYTYAIDFNMANQTYNVVLLNPNSVLSTVSYSQNQESNPYRYVSGGQIIQSNVSFGYFSGLSDTDTGMTGGWHNAIVLDIGFLAPGNVINGHLTQGCGNDNLMFAEKFNPVPEPTTLSLLGFGLLSIARISRKKILA